MDLPSVDVVLRDERVAMISFTGSADVGWKLRERAGRKVVALELGGNAPVIVDETANVEYAAERTAAAAFAHAGQVCISAQRIIVHEQVADRFSDLLVQHARNLCGGDPLGEATELSVMIDEAAAKRAEAWINEAVGGGARILCGGHRDGALLEADRAGGCTGEMRVCRKKCSRRWRQCKDSVIPTHSPKRTIAHGLQAGIFTRDLQRAMLA